MPTRRMCSRSPEIKSYYVLSLLSGETGFDKTVLARFILARKLARQGMPSEFWFVLLGGSFYEYAGDQSLAEQLPRVLDALSSLDAAAVRKSLVRGFAEKEMPETFRERVNDWTEAFLRFIASRKVSESAEPTFIKSALEHAGIRNNTKQKTFARLFNEHKARMPELLGALKKDGAFKKEEIADLRVSFQLAELTRGDFPVVERSRTTLPFVSPRKSARSQKEVRANG